MPTSRRGVETVSIHGLSFTFSRRTYLRPDGSHAYQSLSGRGVKDMDAWVASPNRLLFVEVTSSGTIKKHFVGADGVRRLADDLTARVMHSLLVLAAGLAGMEPAAKVTREHPCDVRGLAVKLVFVVSIGEDRPADVLTLKDLLVRSLRPALTICGLDEHDVVVMTPAQAKRRPEFPYLN